MALTPGQQIVLKIGPDGELAVADGGAARAMTPFDLNVLTVMLSKYAEYGGATPGLITGQAPPPLTPGVVRISFLIVPDERGREARLLVLENGYDKTLKYRAAITRANLTEPTDVCSVLPRLPTYEHWPFPIAEIALSNFTLIPSQQGAMPTCG